jgi:rhamnosyltransferase
MQSLPTVSTKSSQSVAQAVCAVMVTYYPDRGICDRIQRVAAQVPQTVIVDNGSPEPGIQSIVELCDQLPVTLIQNASNKGLASALNTGVRWAECRGFRWVLTLDQDTTVAPDMIDALAQVVLNYPNPEGLAVVGSNYRNKVNGKLFREQCQDGRTSVVREMVSVVTSGSLISVSAFQALGGFRDDLFIDCVDHEYCLRARAHGFHVVITCKPVMEHGIGDLSEHQFLWRTVRTSNHSPLRHYFMTRNSIILISEFFVKEPRWLLRYIWAWLKSIVVILLFEQHRQEKAKSMFRGCIDGFLRRTRFAG